MKTIKFLYLLAILAGTSVLASCSKDDDGDNNNNKEVVPPGPVVGTAERPTDWLNWKEMVEQDYNPQSMTVTCDANNIEFPVSENDLVASFINGVCRGCSEPYVMEDSTVVFFLPVMLIDSDDRTGNLSVTFRYYSHNGKKIYSCGPMSYDYDGHWGSIKEPYIFNWVAE